ncbi:DUF6254 family protein [Metabacillus sp. GX 13764]|nr:DUF6254 family protein [Metabacillus kandeliae]MCD7034274.1 DUF6254 family protein [Metabacillus kandeliae]
MSKPKSREEREWDQRKEKQNPHGEIKSLKELSKDEKSQK